MSALTINFTFYKLGTNIQFGTTSQPSKQFENHNMVKVSKKMQQRKQKFLKTHNSNLKDNYRIKCDPHKCRNATKAPECH